MGKIDTIMLNSLLVTIFRPSYNSLVVLLTIYPREMKIYSAVIELNHGTAPCEERINDSIFIESLRLCHRAQSEEF